MVMLLGALYNFLSQTHPEMCWHRCLVRKNA